MQALGSLDALMAKARNRKAAKAIKNESIVNAKDVPEVSFPADEIAAESTADGHTTTELTTKHVKTDTTSSSPMQLDVNSLLGSSNKVSTSVKSSSERNISTTSTPHISTGQSHNDTNATKSYPLKAYLRGNVAVGHPNNTANESYWKIPMSNEQMHKKSNKPSFIVGPSAKLADINVRWSHALCESNGMIYFAESFLLMAVDSRTGKRQLLYEHTYGIDDICVLQSGDVTQLVAMVDSRGTLSLHGIRRSHDTNANDIIYESPLCTFMRPHHVPGYVRHKLAALRDHYLAVTSPQGVFVVDIRSARAHVDPRNIVPISSQTSFVYRLQPSEGVAGMYPCAIATVSPSDALDNIPIVVGYTYADDKLSVANKIVGKVEVIFASILDEKAKLTPSADISIPLGPMDKHTFLCINSLFCSLQSDQLNLVVGYDKNCTFRLFNGPSTPSEARTHSWHSHARFDIDIGSPSRPLTTLLMVSFDRKHQFLFISTPPGNSICLIQLGKSYRVTWMQLSEPVLGLLPVAHDTKAPKLFVLHRNSIFEHDVTSLIEYDDPGLLSLLKVQLLDMNTSKMPKKDKINTKHTTSQETPTAVDLNLNSKQAASQETPTAVDLNMNSKHATSQESPIAVDLNLMEKDKSHIICEKETTTVVGSSAQSQKQKKSSTSTKTSAVTTISDTTTKKSKPNTVPEKHKNDAAISEYPSNQPDTFVQPDTSVLQEQAHNQSGEFVQLASTILNKQATSTKKETVASGNDTSYENGFNALERMIYDSVSASFDHQNKSFNNRKWPELLALRDAIAKLPSAVAEQVMHNAQPNFTKADKKKLQNQSVELIKNLFQPNSNCMKELCRSVAQAGASVHKQDNSSKLTETMTKNVVKALEKSFTATMTEHVVNLIEQVSSTLVDQMTSEMEVQTLNSFETQFGKIILPGIEKAIKSAVTNIEQRQKLAEEQMQQTVRNTVQEEMMSMKETIGALMNETKRLRQILETRPVMSDVSPTPSRSQTRTGGTVGYEAPMSHSDHEGTYGYNVPLYPQHDRYHGRPPCMYVHPPYYYGVPPHTPPMCCCGGGPPRCRHVHSTNDPTLRPKINPTNPEEKE